LTAALGFVGFAQFVFGFYSWMCTFQTPAPQFPPIPLDSFRYCSFGMKRYQEVILISLLLVYDLSAFSIIIWVARRRGDLGQSKFPSLLDRIIKDATVYFIIIFTSNLIAESFVLFAPPAYSILPAITNMVLMPIMASRLMLSLKKAADKSGAFACTEDLNNATSVVFTRGGHTTMENAMGAGTTRLDRNLMQGTQGTVELEFFENRSGHDIIAWSGDSSGSSSR